MRRREFIAGLAGAAAWPVAARAQQPALPVIGYLSPSTPETYVNFAAAFRAGLSETGFVEGRNVAIEYRFALNDYGRLQDLAADLERRRVSVIVALGAAGALAAKAVTSTIPIVFGTTGDPVPSGLVASFNHPGGNITGITSLGLEVAAKQVGLLHELLPGATRFAVLQNPVPPYVDIVITEAQAAAAKIGRQIEVLHAGSAREIDAAFATVVQKHADAVLVISSALFSNRRVQIVSLATRHAVPAIFSYREDAEAGGLMSYGSSGADRFRQMGIYTGSILKGTKPADLPVVQSTKFEFIINAQTARTLGLTIPETLLATADEVIQ
jgi:putative tryptophan/tyrosine transport system substrate-binding protein